MKLNELPINGGSYIKLVDESCYKVWQGYINDMPDKYGNIEVIGMQPELENYREILVIKLEINSEV